MNNSDVYKAMWGCTATSVGVGNSICNSIWSSARYFVVDSTKQSLYELRKDSIRLLVADFVADSAKDYFKIK